MADHVTPKKLRVLALMHHDLVPPETLEGVDEKQFLWFKATYDVVDALRVLGHDVIKLGVEDEIKPLRLALGEHKPHIVFNLLEGFRGLPYLDQNVVGYLELHRMPYTGNNPRGLILARDKALSKKILHYHRLATPEFMVFPVGRRVNRRVKVEHPLIVKSLTDDSSVGISQASIVHTREKLIERVEFLHETLGSSVIAEQYIEGREFYVGVLGNQVLKVFPTWELKLDTLPPSAARIATEKVKWDLGYQNKHQIKWGPADDLDDVTVRMLERVSKKIYRLLDLSGYARLDFRLDASGRAFFLEANPNPDISSDEELACSAAAAGLNYEGLLQKILNLGLRRVSRLF